MGFAYLLALAIVCTTLGLLIRDMWRSWRVADREWRLARSDEQWAREHRIDL